MERAACLVLGTRTDLTGGSDFFQTGFVLKQVTVHVGSDLSERKSCSDYHARLVLNDRCSGHSVHFWYVPHSVGDRFESDVGNLEEVRSYMCQGANVAPFFGHAARMVDSLDCGDRRVVLYSQMEYTDVDLSTHLVGGHLHVENTVLVGDQSNLLQVV